MLIKLYVAVADALYDSVCHLRHLLASFALETVVHQPLAHELLAQLLLRLTLGKLLLIALSVEVAAGVWRVDFVHQIDGAIMLAKLILGVHQDEATLCSDFCATLEQGQRVFLQQGILFRCSQALGQNLFLGDVCIMFAYLSFGGRGDDGLWELLVLLHSLWQLHATDLTHATLVGTPSAATQIATHDHLQGETLAHHTYGDHRVWRAELPVGADVCGGIQKLGCYLIQYLTLERNAFRQYHVEGRDAIGGHHDQLVIVDVIHIAHLSVVHALLSREVEVCSCYCFHSNNYEL